MMIKKKAYIALAIAFQFAFVSLRGEERPVVPNPESLPGAKVSLFGVLASAESNKLIVMASNLDRNTLIVEDKEDRAEVIRSESFDWSQSRNTHGVFFSSDGKRFGALWGYGRMLMGRGFQIFNDPQQEREVFPVFGDLTLGDFEFGITDDCSTVVAPGLYGVVCWSRRGDEWKEAWAIDYWKSKPEADWPFENNRKLVPSFDAFIPRGADYVLVTFNCSGKEDKFNLLEQPESSHSRYIAALNLKDGKERWRCDVPVAKATTYAHLITSPDGQQIVLQVDSGIRHNGESDYNRIDGGKLTKTLSLKEIPQASIVANKTGWIAIASNSMEHAGEVRRADGTIVWQSPANSPHITSLAFADDGMSLYFSDDKGHLSCADETGKIVWSVAAPRVQKLAVKGNRIYAAGLDGQLTCFEHEGKKIWALDCNTRWAPHHLRKTVSERNNGMYLIQASRAPTTTRKVPVGENLLRSGKATLSVGCLVSGDTKKVIEFNTALLTNGIFDDVTNSWLDGADRISGSAFAEIEFKDPTDVHSLTAYENSTNPLSWPSEAFVQAFDEAEKKWSTVARGLFLVGPTNTYTLNLKGVKKIRYMPWSRFLKSMNTCEIEVR